MSVKAGVAKANNDISLGQALAIGVAVLGLFWLARSPAHALLVMNRLSEFSELNEPALITLSALLLITMVWVTSAVSKLFRLGHQKHAMGEAKKARAVNARTAKGAVVFGIFGGGGFWCLEMVSLSPVRLDLLPFAVTSKEWGLLFAFLGFAASVGIGLFLTRFIPQFGIPFFGRSELPHAPQILDGIVLGAVHEGESKEDSREKRKKGYFPSWLLIGLKGLTGNLFISGAIGSGKSQILLQFLRQLLGNFKTRPALLAIDPKRTFVRELRKIIESQGMAEHLVWVSLQGDVRMNPIWCENMLRNSAFTTIANSLKLASINFIGTSGDSKFWEQSSFNLLKNSLIYCAARYDYFTFKELYRALVQARDEGLAAELVDSLNEKTWNDEERGNIESAIQYFTNEFSQMDEKIRTSVLATATSFLNDFLEYRVSRILSPKKEEISFPSFKDAVLNGKLICLNIENDALARSIGTLIKLLYQEAVLDRVTDGNLADARYALLIMDEYQDVATSGGGAGTGDDRYLAKARESKSITIAATQSVSSLENTIKSEAATRELLQGFRSRIFGNTTDPKTIRVFQEPRGTEEIERSSHSFSETSPDARSDLLFGGYDSARSNVSQGVSTHLSREYPVTAKEFSRLRTFEAFAQIFDGLDTCFEKLYLKPYYLKEIRTAHQKILRDLRESARVTTLKKSSWKGFGLIPLLLGSAACHADVFFPNVCSVVKSSQFSSCLGYSVGACICGAPIPRPCANFNYYVPTTFIEVWPSPKDSFFSALPGAAGQIAAHAGSVVPFGLDDEMGSYAFQGHVLSVPLASEVLSPLPCGGTRSEKACFDLMSEDLGSSWSTGSADTLQPKFLAWGLAKKVCLLKGAVSSVAGSDMSIGGDGGGCSFPLSALPKYPPSTREACNGWGLFYPRSGVYDGGSRSAAALMVASRLKSLGVEVSHTVPGDSDEVWQMLYPESSSCFREGQKPGLPRSGSWCSGRAADFRKTQRLSLCSLETCQLLPRSCRGGDDRGGSSSHPARLPSGSRGRGVMELQTGNPYASLFWDMLIQAQNTLASDIHVQPEEAGVDVRFRVHGELSRWMWIEDQHKTPFLQQAKQLSNCSLAVSGRAQDARIAIPGQKLDVRVNLIPSLFGEKLVLRLLDQRKTFDLGKTGLDPASLQAIRWALDLSDGLVLFTGPTGSGKTTLLYSALTALDQAALNIVTIEDPVEYTFPGITQVQVSPKLSMSDALRAMLRQDPDVILLGEIRDPETAALSFQAAQTGHLVLSTLHANSAFEVASRLSSLGLREDQIHSCLRFSSAQRLLGLLCSKCRVPVLESARFWKTAKVARPVLKAWWDGFRSSSSRSMGVWDRAPKGLRMPRSA